MTHWLDDPHNLWMADMLWLRDQPDVMERRGYNPEPRAWLYWYMSRSDAERADLDSLLSP